MCLGIPMKVIKIEKELAWVQTGGLTRKINVQMVPEVKIGDYVIVHAGFALEVLDAQAAQETLDLIDKIYPVRDYEARGRLDGVSNGVY